MSAEVGVVIIHGMGMQSPEFADKTIRELARRIEKKGKDSSKVAWQRIFWADILDSRQLEYLRNAERMGDLDFKSLRKFIVTALGDAGAYQKVESSSNTTYEQIHDRIADAVNNLYETRLDSKPKPLIVMAHSLGGHIMSNYIWDMQHLKDSSLSSFERMEKLAGMITFGCNIPLFTFAHSKVEPIKFPGSKLSAELKKKAKWLNFYDPDDVLGYPLKAINADYRKVVSKDIPINVGGIATSWNPMAHNGYWTDNDFTKPVAQYISKFV